MWNVLVLCTGNSARSILAEALLELLGEGRIGAYSAGSAPKGVVNPHALALTRSWGFPDKRFRSKSWDEFAHPDAPRLNAVITVCDGAAGETCPVWPGHPATTHWGLPDPAAVTGTKDEVGRAFGETADQLRRRVEGLVGLPLERLSGDELKVRLAAVHAEAAS